MKQKLNTFIEQIDTTITGGAQFENSRALEYQEYSKYDKYSFLKEQQRFALFKSPFMMARCIRPYKMHATKNQIALNPLKLKINDDFLGTLEKRRSERKFSGEQISLFELFKLLHFSYGITGQASMIGGKGIWNYRAVPSGGALYPLEIYLYLHKCSLSSGIYHYRPDTESLEVLAENEYMEFIQKNVASGNIEMNNACCVVFITSMFQRTMLKYGDRGYRFVLNEVGAVEQNISIICTHLGLKSCILGGYLDDEINRLLGFQGPLETVQGVMVIGK